MNPHDKEIIEKFGDDIKHKVAAKSFVVGTAYDIKKLS